MRLAPVITAALAAVLLAGCSAAEPQSPASSPAVQQGAITGDAAAILAKYDLADLTPEELVAELDAATEDRTDGPVGSVRPTELVISDGGKEARVPLAEGQFYLAIAPYINKTHDCYNHNLASCQGELANETIHVKITDSSGETLVDEDLTTYANGFAGMWLPSDIEADLEVTYGDKSVSSPISTGPDDPTCLTTLQLQ